ncbi:hypothetical protein Mal4_54060 [Maioricimonas rarisocia]|uniref:Uncharacterized protein n=1 Tax=Maioricimonas rarisocia TaxID=2528026 RepID=A0A517ZEZ8_9PLAN|nr:hypothetical protein [Maioricimonas rarisocia]QDU41041.1 hypothetical protein Mal4_54060 [Maioricimonas rarisocia]
MQLSTLTEQLPDWHRHLNVDREQRIVRNVALTGRHSKNGYTYSEAALSAAVSLYDGKPVFLDHAADRARSHERSTRDLVGSIVGPRFESGRIHGDIRVLDTESGRTFLALVEGETPGVGMSHVVLAERSPDDGCVERIHDVVSVDAVVNPATTTTFRETIDTEEGSQLTEVEVSDLTQLKADVEQLRQERDQLREELRNLQARHESEQRRQRVTELLVEAGLPAEAMTDLFRQQLAVAPDDAARRALIAERATLVQSLAARQPVSLERAGEDRSASDARFISAIRRRS